MGYFRFYGVNRGFDEANPKLIEKGFLPLLDSIRENIEPNIFVTDYEGKGYSGTKSDICFPLRVFRESDKMEIGFIVKD